MTDLIVNPLWTERTNPSVTILTPVFNRRDLLPRAMASVQRQSCKDLEYILVNDGSTVELDDIVLPFLSQADFPMAYIKKENGGVHTARNAAIRLSRGEMMLFLDSDDEYVPEAVEVFLKAWRAIPDEIRDDYREVGAFCQDEQGRRIGIPYPDNMNRLPYPEQRRIRVSHQRGEQTALLRADLMRANPWPEPEGVNFVHESLVWRKLDGQYKTWSINDALRIYHTETAESYTRTGLNKRLQKQTLTNRIYHSKYCFEHPDEICSKRTEWLWDGLWYKAYDRIFKWVYGDLPYPWHTPEKFIGTGKLLQMPGFVLAAVYYLYAKIR